MIDIAKAHAELAQKTKKQIEAETAETWAARAIVSYQRFAALKTLNFFAEAVDYEHEAMEHAAEGGNAAYVSATIGDAKRRLGLP